MNYRPGSTLVRLRFGAVGLLCSTLLGCGAGAVSPHPSPPVPPVPAVLDSISLSPISPTVPVGSTQQFKANGTFSDGTNRDVTTEVNWSSSSTAVATVTGGLAKAVGLGRAQIQAEVRSGKPVSASATLTVTTGLEMLHHIIFLVQENRAFDNYFSVLGSYRASPGKVPGASPTDVDGAENLNPQPQLLNAANQLIGRYPFRTVCHDNLSAGWFFSHDDVNSGMQDFLINAANANIPGASVNDPDGDRPIGYYDQTDLPYYYELATQFATSDRMFAPILGPTEINRMYLFAGTSFGWFEIPIPSQFPVGSPPTIFDKLDQAGVTWRNYYHDNNHVFIRAWPGFYDNTNQYQSTHAVPIFTTNPDGSIADPIGQWKTDLQNESTLPQVIFIERGGCTPNPNNPETCTDFGVTGTDEHPGANIQVGAADTANIINALMQSPAWASSVFILVYDEGGGTYDHVPAASAPAPDSIPPSFPTGTSTGGYNAFNQTGFRVPNIVVSPWVRPQFVSHTVRDYTSILRLIEDRFGLQPLTQRDAHWDDLREFFDFTSPHLQTPPPLPTQPTNGFCSFAAETP